MKETLSRKVAIPKGARRKVYYDTQPLKADQTRVNFFPAQADRAVHNANYISNPFPGEDARLVYGMLFTLSGQYIADDDDNNIDAQAIINAVKDAGVVANADQDYKEFMRVPLSNHFDFEDTRLNIGATYDSTGDSYGYSKTVVMEEPEMYRVADPFVIAPNQNLNLFAEFNDASAFPADSDWTNSDQAHLQLQCRISVAELTPDMQS